MKKILSIIVAAVAVLMVGVAPVYAADDICADLDPSIPNYHTLCEGGDETTLLDTVKSVLNTVYLWVGIIAVVVIIIGGFKYTMSQGDAAKVKSAKDTILYAIIGLIVALAAFAITNFILGAMGA